MLQQYWKRVIPVASDSLFDGQVWEEKNEITQVDADGAHVGRQSGSYRSREQFIGKHEWYTLKSTSEIILLIGVMRIKNYLCFNWSFVKRFIPLSIQCIFNVDLLW